MAAPRLVMMEGPPGAGKSTLADALVARLTTTRLVEYLPEEAIFTRPEFADVGRAFRTKVFPTPDLLLAAYRRIFDAAAAASASVVADWSALAMIEDLPCAQPDRTSVTSDVPSAVADAAVLEQHAVDVRIAWGDTPTLLVLRLPVAAAVGRAVTQRGDAWVRRQEARWPDVLGPGSSVTQLALRFADYEHRREAMVRAYEAAGWDVVDVDASMSSSAVVVNVITSIFQAGEP